MIPIVVLEIGINHQGSVTIAERIINRVMRKAVNGFPKESLFFKFQKRAVETEVPKSQWYLEKEHPLTGKKMNYIDYKRSMEFGKEDYKRIDALCKEHGVGWFFSIWGDDSLQWAVDNIYSLPYIKIPSALAPKIASNQGFADRLLEASYMLSAEIIVSTGGLTYAAVKNVARSLVLNKNNFTLLACTSTYPTPMNEVNLSRIETMQEIDERADIGYSSHSKSPIVPIMAAALGARVIEFHITIDRAWRGSDHAASIEIPGVEMILRDIVAVDEMMGDGMIGPMASEIEKLETLIND